MPHPRNVKVLVSSFKKMPQSVLPTLVLRNTITVSGEESIFIEWNVVQFKSFVSRRFSFEVRTKVRLPNPPIQEQMIGESRELGRVMIQGRMVRHRQN
jgi:hypothetical protein